MKEYSIAQIIKAIQDTDEKLMNCDGTVTDYARYEAHICMLQAIDYLRKNEEREDY